MRKNIGLLCLMFSLFAAKCSAPQFKIETRRAWSVRFRKCECQHYDFNQIKALDSFVPCEVFFNDPTTPNYMFCDDLVGFNDEAWALRITPTMKETQRWVKDSCTK